jgi:outer membrane protein assembly factor BamE (lipoprotein component of BamABCDE complex)
MNRSRHDVDGRVPRWANNTLVFALAMTSAGCLILPTPEFDSGEARANIKKKTPAQFEPGKTTRAEVILALGEPDAVSPDECSLVYRSEKVCGLWFVGGYYSGAGGTIERDRYLVAEFDAHGVLAKFERSAPWVGSKPPGVLVRSTTLASQHKMSGRAGSATPDTQRGKPDLPCRAGWENAPRESKRRNRNRRGKPRRLI